MTPQASGLPPGPASFKGGGRPAPKKPAPGRIRIKLPVRQRMWQLALRAAFIGGAVMLVVGVAVYFSLAGLIDDRLHGERERSVPRVYARPIEIRRGQTFTQQDLVARLNDIGYAQRPDVAQPGEFAIKNNEIAITPRTGNLKGQMVRVVFPAAPKNACAPDES